MYDKLIERLRTDAIWVVSPLRDDMTEAVNAIEVLNRYAETMRKLKCEGWYLQQNKYQDGYQAIATMPLPELQKEE